MKKLEGQIAISTGGSSGIGLATAKLFVNEGAHVFITGPLEPELVDAVKQIGKRVTGVQGDVTNADDCSPRLSGRRASSTLSSRTPVFRCLHPWTR
jgi:NAD(P)-dependent dehydrogenase (short-subunit alcohol dehydrogenase family)